MPDFDRIREVKRGARERLFAIPGVHCVGIGPKQVAGQYTNEHAIVVSVTRKKPLGELQPGEAIPAEIDGVKLDVVASPVPRLLSEDTNSYPSLRGGIQIKSGGRLSRRRDVRFHRPIQRWAEDLCGHESARASGIAGYDRHPGE